MTGRETTGRTIETRRARVWGTETTARRARLRGTETTSARRARVLGDGDDGAESAGPKRQAECRGCLRFRLRLKPPPPRPPLRFCGSP